MTVAEKAGEQNQNTAVTQWVFYESTFPVDGTHDIK